MAFEFRWASVNVNENISPQTKSSSLFEAGSASECYELHPTNKVVRTESEQERNLCRHKLDGMWENEKTSDEVERRNERERTRVHNVNQAFYILKCSLPSVRANLKRVSKLKILRAAINYINMLTAMLNHEPSPDIEPNFSSMVRYSGNVGPFLELTSID